MNDKSHLLAMGFAEAVVDRALRKTKNTGLQPAIDWIVDHGEEPPSDNEQEEDVQPGEAHSLKCDDCGKLFRNTTQAELHSVKTEHQHFSESTQEIKPLTEEEKKQKLLELQERMKQRKEERMRAEIEEEKNRHVVKKATAAEMAALREKLQEQEMKKEVEERKRQKEEDRKAKEVVRKQLEMDKLERKRQQEEKKLQAAGIAPVVKQELKQSVPTRNYDEARIQFRVPSGPPVVHVFKATDTIQSLYDFCKQHHPGNFQLLQSFPRKVLTEMNLSLKDAGLCPSAALVLQ